MIGKCYHNIMKRVAMQHVGNKGHRVVSVSKQILSKRSTGIVLALIFIMVVLSILSRDFLTFTNLITVIRQAVVIGVMSIGMTFVIGMGGIDLSVGSVLALCSVVLAGLMLAGVNVWLSMLACLITGLLVGCFNGVLIAKMGMPDFIVTLAVMSIARGIVWVYTKGYPLYGLDDSAFQFLFQGYVGPVPFPIILLLIVFAIAWVVLNRTRYGRYVVSIGSNQEAAKLVGIGVANIKVITYGLCGFFSAFAGVLLVSRLGTAMHDAGMGYELDVIAAVVLGGTSLSGGRANLVGSLVGAIIMVMVRNGLNLLNVNTFWHTIVIGVIILVAVFIDTVSRGGVGRNTMK